MNSMRSRNAACLLALSCGLLSCSDDNVAIGVRVPVDAAAVVRDDADVANRPDARASEARPLDAGDAVCAFAEATVTQRPATVWLVVERSAVMNSTVKPSPWDRLRVALVGDEGLVTQAGPELRMGLVRHGSNAELTSCPALAVVPPVIENRDAVDVALREEAGTRDAAMVSYALGEVLSALESGRTPGPSAVVILRHSALGADVVCAADSPDGQAGNSWIGVMRAYETAQRVVDAGASLYVVDFSNFPLLEGLENTSERLAAIGGRAAYHMPLPIDDVSTASLRTSLQDISRTATSCEFALDGQVKLGQECEGSVTLNGLELPCGDANGWRLKDESTVELVGQACDALRAGPQAQLSARFPCDVYIAF